MRAIMTRLVPLCALLCYGQQKNNGGAFQKGFGLYLHCHGTKQTVMEVLHKFNLCPGRGTVQKLLQESKDRGKNAIRAIGQRPNSVIHYDNLEQLQKVNQQRHDSRDKFFSVTTGYVIQGVQIDGSGLKSNMMNYDQELQRHEVLENPGLSLQSDDNKQVYPKHLNPYRAVEDSCILILF